MNPFDLTASELIIWGIVLHLIADWPLQNDWMANNKAKRQDRLMIRGNSGWRYGTVWYVRHPAAYVHAGIHGLLLAIVFGWVALPLALVHLVIDTRWPVVAWSKLIKQTQPRGEIIRQPVFDEEGYIQPETNKIVLYDIGTEVRFWTDFVFHVATIAIAAILVG